MDNSASKIIVDIISNPRDFFVETLIKMHYDSQATNFII